METSIEPKLFAIYIKLFTRELVVIVNTLEYRVRQKKKKLAASSMLHEAKVAYYAFDVAARFLIWLFMPFLWLR